MNAQPGHRWHRIVTRWPWFVALVPALVLLAIMAPLCVPVPYLDSWEFVRQYREWMEGRYGWREFLAPYYDHPSVPGKAIYFAVLHWLGGDFRVVPILSWLFSLVAAACVWLLSRPLWRGNRKLGAVVMFCASLTIFNAAQGGAWIWDFAVQNYIPVMCLAAGIWVLSAGALCSWRILAAALLSIVAAFSCGAGLPVGALFSLLIWHGMRGRSTAWKTVAVVAWLAFAGAAAWLALRGFDVSTRSRAPSSVMMLFDRPWVRLQFVLILLGRMLGEGTVFEPQVLCTVAGGVVLVVFASSLVFVFRHRHDPDLMSASLPWLTFGLYGLGTAVMICIGRMDKTFSQVLAERYVMFTMCLVLGTFFLVLVVLQHGEQTSAPVRLLRKAVGPALTLFLAAQLANWEWGRQAMNVENMIMEQERALLVFARVLPLDPDRLWNRFTRNSTAQLAIFMSDHGCLQGVKFATDNRIAAFEHGSPVSRKWARFEKVTALGDGRWEVGGVCGFDEFLPDLVLITAKTADDEERIISLAAPKLPSTFFEGRDERRNYPEHFFGWRQTLDAASLPKGAVTLRAYVFEQDFPRVRPMEGVHTFEPVAK